MTTPIELSMHLAGVLPQVTGTKPHTWDVNL